MFRELKLSRPLTLDIRDFKNILINEVNLPFRAKVSSYISENYQVLGKFFNFEILPSYIGYIEFGEGDLYPHTDDHRFALNIIIEDQNAVTKFWKSEYGPESTHDNSKNYNLKKCKLLGEFKANKGSAWFYDLHVIHSVHCPEPEKTRKLITMRWNETGLDFNQMYKTIKVL